MNSTLHQAARIHQRIKRYYLSRGHTEADWNAVSHNPALFNQVWRALLQLPPNTTPPPVSVRSG